MTKLVRLSHKEIEEILKDYNIGSYMSHKHIPWSFGNSVYRIQTSKGKFILKIHQDISPQKLKFVISLMEYTRKKQIPMAEIVKNRSRTLISKYRKKP